MPSVNIGFWRFSTVTSCFFFVFFLRPLNVLTLTLKEVVSAVDLYADDTTIYDIQTDKTLLQRNLQLALNLLHIWCKENGLLVNTDKTKVMFLTTRPKRATLSEDVLALKYDDINLHLSNNEKVLGIYIDENFIWTAHFMHVSRKVSSNLWLLSQIKNYLSLEHRLLFYDDI